MKRRWLALGCVAAVSASGACAGSNSQPQQQESTTNGGESQAAQGPRQRPRRRAVTRALTATALRAEGCVPPTVTEGVTVTGAFVGPTGELRVARVDSPQPLSQDVRTCIREEFERAHVEPFTDARFEVTHTFGTPGGDGGVPSTAVATATGTTAVPSENTPSATDAGAASTNAGAGGAMGNAGAPPDAGSAATREHTTVATATPREVEPTPTTTTTTTTTTHAPTPMVTATASPRENGLASPPSRNTPITQAGPIPAGSLIGCYRGAIRSEPILAGRIRLQFTVTNDGVIQNVQVAPVGAIRGRAPVFAQAMHCIEQRVRVQAHDRRNAGYHDLVISLIPRNTGEISIERNNVGLTSSAPGLNATADAHEGTAPDSTTTATLTNAAPEGQLEMSQVANVMRGRVAEIRTCYQTQLTRDPQLQLRLRVRFSIEPNGTVPAASSTTVVQAGDGDVAGDVAHCVEGIVRTTTFPTRTTSGTQEASLPFVFSPGSGTAQARGTAPAAPTTGRIDPVRVSAAIRNQTPVLRDCYTRALAGDPQLAGRVVVRFVVDPYGHLNSLASQAQTQAGDPARLVAVGHCLEGVMAGMELPPPTGGSAAVALPFDFGPNQ